MRKIEEKIGRVEQQKLEKLEKRKEDLRTHSEVVSSRLHHMKDLSNTFNTEKFAETFQKIQKSDKIKSEYVKNVQEQLK